VAPAFATKLTLSAPFAPIVTEVDPAGTLAPVASVNAGQLINTVPCAAVPSARYTVSVTLVVAIADAVGVCATAHVPNDPSSRPHARQNSTSVHPFRLNFILTPPS
jgi:hypothetical protein